MHPSGLLKQINSLQVNTGVTIVPPHTLHAPTEPQSLGGDTVCVTYTLSHINVELLKPTSSYARTSAGQALRKQLAYNTEYLPKCLVEKLSEIEGTRKGNHKCKLYQVRGQRGIRAGGMGPPGTAYQRGADGGRGRMRRVLARSPIAIGHANKLVFYLYYYYIGQLPS